MKALFAIMMIAVAISLASFTMATHPLTVEGKLVIHAHRERKCQFEIIVKGDDKTVATTKVDTTGHFELSFTPADQQTFDFFYTDSHHITDTIFLKSYSKFDSDQMEITFYTFKGVLQADENNHILCPKCRQSDKVDAIEGLPGYYYCSRDRIKF